MRRIALSVVLTVLGVGLIAGGVVSIFPNALLGLEPYLGTHSSVAAVALGFGICLAAVNPAAYISWVRIAIVYVILSILYELVLFFYLGLGLEALPLSFGIVCAVLLVALYPNRGDLLPKSPRTPEAAGTLPGTNPGAARA